VLLVIGRIVVKPDVVSRLGVIVQGAGVRVVFGADHERRSDEPAEKIHERRRSIEIEKVRRIPTNLEIADASAFFMAGDIVPVELGLELHDRRNETFLNDGLREKAGKAEKLVVLPVGLTRLVEIQTLHSLLNGLCNLARTRGDQLGDPFTLDSQCVVMED